MSKNNKNIGIIVLAVVALILITQYAPMAAISTPRKCLSDGGIEGCYSFRTDGEYIYADVTIWNYRPESPWYNPYAEGTGDYLAQVGLEIQIPGEEGQFAIVGSEELCNPAHKEDVYRSVDIDVNEGTADSASFVIKSPLNAPLGPGTYQVKLVSVDACCGIYPCSAVSPFGWGTSVESLTIADTLDDTSDDTPDTITTTITDEPCTQDSDCGPQNVCYPMDSCYNGFCEVRYYEPLQPPCEGAIFTDYPSCDWDTSQCECTNEGTTCHEGDVWSYCDQEYIRITENCKEDESCVGNKCLSETCTQNDKDKYSCVESVIEERTYCVEGIWENEREVCSKGCDSTTGRCIGEWDDEEDDEDYNTTEYCTWVNGWAPGGCIFGSVILVVGAITFFMILNRIFNPPYQSKRR